MDAAPASVPVLKKGLGFRVYGLGKQAKPKPEVTANVLSHLGFGDVAGAFCLETGHCQREACAGECSAPASRAKSGVENHALCGS